MWHCSFNEAVTTVHCVCVIGSCHHDITGTLTELLCFGPSAPPHNKPLWSHVSSTPTRLVILCRNTVNRVRVVLGHTGSVAHWTSSQTREKWFKGCGFESHQSRLLKSKTIFRINKTVSAHAVKQDVLVSWSTLSNQDREHRELFWYRHQQTSCVFV